MPFSWLQPLQQCIHYIPLTIPNNSPPTPPPHTYHIQSKRRPQLQCQPHFQRLHFISVYCWNTYRHTEITTHTHTRATTRLKLGRHRNKATEFWVRGQPVVLRLISWWLVFQLGLWYVARPNRYGKSPSKRSSRQLPAIIAVSGCIICSTCGGKTY